MSGGDIPSEPTFSRAFTKFAKDQLPQQIHAHMVKAHAGPKFVDHVSRDAPAIVAPERPTPKPAAAPTPPKPRGRPKKGEVRPATPLKRLERQPARPLGHVPIIDPHPRGREKVPLAPAQAERFKERSATERVNSLLKDRYGGRWVRGAAKVMCHLMFGLVALTATALFAGLC